MPWERSVDAAESPARPEPTTMACFWMAVCVEVDVMIWRSIMDEIAIKIEMNAILRIMKQIFRGILSMYELRSETLKFIRRAWPQLARNG